MEPIEEKEAAVQRNFESDLESRFVKHLNALGYRKNALNTVDGIWLNIRKHLDRLNEAKGGKLTDSEFESLKRTVSSYTIYQCAAILKGKIIPVEDEKNGKRSVYIISDDPKDNILEEAEQVKVHCRYDDRFDVSVFLNGFPFFQIELKAAGVANKQAFNQIIRYKNEGAYDGVFHFLRGFVISDEANTRYFCNNDSEILKSNEFRWTDSSNARIDGLKEFTDSFFAPDVLVSLGVKYMAMSQSDKRLMILRPYQYFAIKALEKRFYVERKNGFVWHTMGSGKTLTSFMFAKTLADDPSVDRVFFIVDRTDLDKKSVDDFKTYDPTFDQEIIGWTGNLIKQIKERKLVVTTIFKIDKAVRTHKYAKDIEFLKGKNVVFIYDECHRSQIGSMRKDIDAFFNKPVSYGFTGTPIFKAEKDVKITADLFDSCVHMYLLHQAIADGNILEMSPTYIETIRNKDNVPLEEMVKAIDKQGAIEDKGRVELIAQDILFRYPAITKHKTYNAILACNSIPQLILYYDWLKANAPKDFSFAAVFTYEENQDMPDGELTASDKDSLKRIMGDYADATGHQFTFDPTGRKAYDMELATRFGDRTLDLLIVVKKYLTGANFRRCNTLFLDRALKSHELIQAFARTVRTEKETKDQGNIVCYQTTKKDVNDALVEYSNGDMANVHSLAKDYGELIADFMAAMAATKLTNPDSRSKEEQDEFVAAFGKAVHDFEKLSLYPEFDLDKGIVPGVTLHDYNILKSKYKDIWDERHKPGQPDSIQDNVEFVINVLETDTIDYDYIFDLLKDITDTPDPSIRERIIRIIEGIADKSKAGLIKEFVDQTMSIKISEDDDVRDRFGRFIKEKQQKDVEAIASKYRIPASRVALIAFSFLRTDDVPTAKESVISVIMETPPRPSNVRELTEKTDALTLEIASFRDKYKGFISFGA